MLKIVILALQERNGGFDVDLCSINPVEAAASDFLSEL
jgi:hypothetical protein